MNSLIDVTPLWDTLFMLIEAARRAEAAAKEMLALVTEGAVSCAEILEALAVSKAVAGVNSAFQVAGATAVAGRERHGDGGAEVLAASAGLSRREAHSQVKTAEALRRTQKLRDAVAEGRVPIANAKRLAEAVEKTSVDAVDSDGELLAKAESMRPEQFAREARRWVTDRDGDGGESEHARQQARRCVRVWDGDDGMVHLHGQFDSVTGRRIGNRLRAESARMFDADKKSSEDSAERRSFPQCMADALDNLTATNKNAGGGGKPIADICVVAHVDDATGKLIAEIPGGDRLPRSVRLADPRPTRQTHPPSPRLRDLRFCPRFRATPPARTRHRTRFRPSTAVPARRLARPRAPTCTIRSKRCGPLVAARM